MERYRSDKRVDGRETVGNSLERAPVGIRCDTGVTRGWTEGKPLEIAWESSGGKERYGSDDKVDGGETVGNSLGRFPLGGNGWKQRLGGRRGKSSVGRSDAGVMTGWTARNRGE